MVFTGNFPGRVFFHYSNHEKGVPEAPYKGIERVRGAPPGTESLGGHVKSGP